MTSARKIVLSLACAATLASCGMVSDIAETQKKSEAIALALEKELGAKPLVGWNIHNERLTNVQVSFPLESVARLEVGALEARVRAVVTRSFDKPPEQLVVSTFSGK